MTKFAIFIVFLFFVSVSAAYASDTVSDVSVIEAQVQRNVENNKTNNCETQDGLFKNTVKTILYIPLLPVSVVVTPLVLTGSWFVVYNETRKNPELRMFVGM